MPTSWPAARSVLTRLRGRLAAASAATLRGDRAAAAAPLPRKDSPTSTGIAAGSRSTELRVLASAHGVELGQLALRALRGTSSPGEGVHWMERNRAAALLAVQRTPVEGFAEEFEQLRAMTGEHRGRRRCVRGAGRAARCARSSGSVA